MGGVLVVAGQGRCGSSAVMRALNAGGLPCLGRFPDYEPAEAAPPLDPAWLARQTGCAVKVLMPQLSRVALLAVPHTMILLRRNAREQAKSQVKLVRAGNPELLVRAGRRQIAALAESITRDDDAAARLFRPALTVPFERLLAAPFAVFEELAAVLQACGWPRLDTARAAKQIHARRAACRPDMNAELEAMLQASHHA